MRLIDPMLPEGISNTAEISAGVRDVNLNNPTENSTQDEKAAISAITRSLMQCEQTTNMKRLQGVSSLVFCFILPDIPLHIFEKRNGSR